MDIENDIILIAADQNFLSGIHESEITPYNPTAHLDNLPANSQIWVDLLPSEGAEVPKEIVTGFVAEFGRYNTGAGAEDGEVFFTDRTARIAYPKHALNLDGGRQVFEMVVNASYFRRDAFRREHPKVVTAADAQGFLVSRIRDWTRQTGLKVREFDLARGEFAK